MGRMLVIGVVALAGCFAILPRPPCPAEGRAPAGMGGIDDRDRAVFRALSSGGDVIVDRTSGIDAPFGVRKVESPRMREMLPRLVERNQGGPAAISRVGNGACLITETQLRVVSDTHDFWSVFRDVFGGRRLLHLSLPAYSDDGRTALVYAGWTVDYLAGEGNLVLLERDGAGAGWRVVDSVLVWIS